MSSDESDGKVIELEHARRKRKPPDDELRYDEAGYRLGVSGKRVSDCKENAARLFDELAVRVRWNRMTRQQEVTVANMWMPITGNDDVTLQMLENAAADRGLKRLMVAPRLWSHATVYHPAWDWVTSKPWDEQSRLVDLLDTITLTYPVKRPLAARLLRAWSVGAVRAIDPNSSCVEQQGVLILQGEVQGYGKTRWVKRLVTIDSGIVLTGRWLNPHDRDSIQQGTRAWITELGELDATLKKADIAALKAFLTDSHDVYRTAYGRREARHRRTTAFVATLNPDTFLGDPTGNRRYWVIALDDIDAEHKVDMQQYWAECLTLAKAGEPHWLTRAETADLEESNEAHVPDSTLAQMVRRYWTVDRSVLGITLREVVAGLPSFDTRLPDKSQEIQIGYALKKIGARGRRTSEGRLYHVVRNAITSQPIGWQDEP